MAQAVMAQTHARKRRRDIICLRKCKLRAAQVQGVVQHVLCKHKENFLI